MIRRFAAHFDDPSGPFGIASSVAKRLAKPFRIRLAIENGSKNGSESNWVDRHPFRTVQNPIGWVGTPSKTVQNPIG